LADVSYRRLEKSKTNNAWSTVLYQQGDITDTRTRHGNLRHNN